MAFAVSLNIAAAAAAALLLGYTLVLAVYRLYLHPLAKFPGPKLAAVTYLYEFYHDGLRAGQYRNVIKDMHKRYGSIIRTDPYELHIDDVNYIDQLYPGASRKSDKFEYYTVQFGVSASFQGAVTHERHRMLRSAFNRFFSKAVVAKMDIIIKDAAAKLCQKIEDRKREDGPLNIVMAYSCFTTEVICQYCYGKSAGYLDRDGFQETLRPAISGAARSGPFIKQWPFLFTMLDSLPDRIVGALMPDMAAFLRFASEMQEQVAAIVAGKGEYEKRAETCPTIFHELLDSDRPEEEKQPWRLGQEGTVLLAAGTETTAWTLSAITFHLLDKPALARRLENELQDAGVDAHILPSQAKLEQLPFFSATVQEGTPVGMTSVLIHHNEDLFYDSWSFIPDRWLDASGQRRYDLDKYMFSFTRGSRQCLGMNLAYAELYLALSMIVLRLIDRLELFETTEDAVKYDHECFVPVPKGGFGGSRGVRVLMK